MSDEYRLDFQQRVYKKLDDILIEAHGTVVFITIVSCIFILAIGLLIYEVDELDKKIDKIIKVEKLEAGNE